MGFLISSANKTLFSQAGHSENWKDIISLAEMIHLVPHKNNEKDKFGKKLNRRFNLEMQHLSREVTTYQNMV